MVGVGHEVDENTTGAVDHLPASRVQECHHHLINWGEKERERAVVMHSGPKPCDISHAPRSSPSFCHLQIDFFFVAQVV